MKLKRWISLLLVTAMLIGDFPAVVWTARAEERIGAEVGGEQTAALAGTVVAEGSCGNGLLWVLADDGVLTISGWGTMHFLYGGAEGAPWYRHRTKIRKVVIGDGVENLCDYAFYGCTDLTSIEIADSVQSIGKYAFWECINLDSLAIPNLVESIDEYTFYSCINLTSIELSNSVRSIGEFAFYGCTSLNSIEIPNSVQSIEDYAFFD